jgi:hypothetical protein
MTYRGAEFNKYSSFKSRGEREIGKFLDGQSIAYQYEYPLAIKDRDQVRIWYPDFRLPEYGMIIEYFGMNGDAAYNEQMAHKMLSYKEAGIDGIYLLESSFLGNWQEQIMGRIEQSLEGKLSKIASCQSDYYSAMRGV